jgi:hypothetical protein
LPSFARGLGGANEGMKIGCFRGGITVECVPSSSLKKENEMKTMKDENTKDTKEVEKLTLVIELDGRDARLVKLALDAFFKDTPKVRQEFIRACFILGMQTAIKENLSTEPTTETPNDKNNKSTL